MTPSVTRFLSHGQGRGAQGARKVLCNYRPETFLRRHLDLYEGVCQGWMRR